MAARIKLTSLLISICIPFLSGGNAECGYTGQENASVQSVSSEHSDAADLLNWKFKPGDTVRLKYGGAATGFQAVQGAFFGKVGAGEAETLYKAEGRLSAEGPAQYRQERATGSYSPREEQAGQNSIWRSISEKLWPAMSFGLFHSANSSAYDFDTAGSSDRPRFQFRFSLNRYSPEGSLLPFFSAPSGPRDISIPRDETASYFGPLGGLFVPSMAKLNNHFYSWRPRGFGSPSEEYSGLSNSIENENPLIGAFSSFIHPLNPVTVKTSYKSHNMTAQNDSAIDPARVDRFPFTKKDANFDAQWDFDAPFSVNFGYQWQRWERDPEYWENASTDEHSARIGAKTSPFSWLNLSAFYSQSLRMGSNYSFMEANPEKPEKLLLPKFSLADRSGAKLDFKSEFVPAKQLNIALNCGFSSDTYDKSAVGITDGTSWTAGAAITWTPISRLAFNVNFQHEEFSTRQGLGSSSTAGLVNASDTLDTIGMAINFSLIPDKLSFISRGSYSVSNSGSIGNTDGSSGDLTRIESFLRYSYNRQLSLRCGYMHESLGAGQNSLSFWDPITNKTLKSYSSHVGLGVINYDF